MAKETRYHTLRHSSFLYTHTHAHKHTHIRLLSSSALLCLSHSDLWGRLCNAALLRTRHENINTTSLHFNHVNKQGHPNFQLELVWKAGNGVDEMRPHPFSLSFHSKSWSESVTWHGGTVCSSSPLQPELLPITSQGRDSCKLPQIQIWSWNDGYGFDT